MNKKEYLEERLEKFNKELWSNELELRVANRVKLTETKRMIVTVGGTISIDQQIMTLTKDIKHIKEFIDVILDTLNEDKKVESNKKKGK